MSQSIQPSAYLQGLAHIAIAAGREIMGIYGQTVPARAKDDLSPVTEADEAAERLILAELAKFEPGTPIISEEAAAAGNIPNVSGRFYLVDPLDGTKEFLSRNGEFTVNIALIEAGRPKAGAVYAPALSRLFCGEADGGAFQAIIAPNHGEPNNNWTALSVRRPPADGLTVVASRSHRDEKTNKWLKSVNVKNLVSAGSSLKFCLVASGEADLYPRFGRTMEWDTAAGHAVLAAAGGKVITEAGEPLTYGKKQRGFDNPGFIASA
jgi:3'(2'), 5'-bisphosphate nucleotidase